VSTEVKLVWCLRDADDHSDHPDLQEKVRRAIIDGHIAPEDFNGVSCLIGEVLSFIADMGVQDPEMNVLGQKGIHKRKPKVKEEDGNEVGSV
jgi:serine/threonine-protein kinase ATR